MKTMPPNDLGKIFLTDECCKIEINSFIKAINKRFKGELLKSELEANGIKINLTKTCTGYGGERFWLLCPMCNKRRGVLYRHPVNQHIACRTCLGLKYRSNTKKGMIENQFK
jgi:hypothetical protein